MIIAVGVVAAGLLAVAAAVRTGGASLIRTSRAEALQDAGDGVRGSVTVAALLEDRNQIQPALGTTVTFLIVAAVIPLTWILTDVLSGGVLGGALIALAVVLVVFVDVIPRWIGRNRPRTAAYRLSAMLRIAIVFGEAAGDLIPDPDEDDPHELDSDAEERELIMSVLEFRETLVREVMVPRPDMITIPGEAAIDDAVDLVLESGRSRIPVTGESIDDIVGVLFARDLLEVFDKELDPGSAEGIVHDAYFVPETKQVSKLLKEMQAKQQHLAIVIDEFGGTAGMVTIEDLIEEIVGEIVDEFDDEEPMVQEIDGGWVVDGKLDVDDLAELSGIELPDEEWDTVGGLVFGLAGRVPDEGDTFDVEGLRFTAQSVDGRRISRVKVARL
ncbi:MAG: hemolysin family protein [Actinomycetota bacterium]